MLFRWGRDDFWMVNIVITLKENVLSYSKWGMLFWLKGTTCHNFIRWLYNLLLWLLHQGGRRLQCHASSFINNPKPPISGYIFLYLQFYFGSFALSLIPFVSNHPHSSHQNPPLFPSKWSLPLNDLIVLRISQFIVLVGGLWSKGFRNPYSFAMMR